MAKDVKQEIINVITEEMEKSNRLPWDSGLLNGTFYAANWKTGKLYRGINQILLHFFGKSETAEYMTFVQAKDSKASVKKGAKGVPVIKYALWNYTKKRYALDNDDKDDVIKPFIRKYYVFPVQSVPLPWGSALIFYCKGVLCTDCIPGARRARCPACLPCWADCCGPGASAMKKPPRTF